MVRPKLIRATAVVALGTLLSACGATEEVKQAVAARHAAEAAAGGHGAAAAALAPAAGLPAPADAPATAPRADTGATAATPAAGAPTGPRTAAAPRKATAAAAAGGAPAATAAVAACGANGAAVPAAGSGGGTATGVTATTIKIGGTFFNGGFLDKYGQVAENAPRAYFNYINDAGGICGRKISYVTCDTAGTADGTSGCLSRMADQDKVFIMGPSLDFNLDIVPATLARLKLPWVGSSGLYSEEFASPWMFPTQPPGDSVGQLITRYATTKLGSKKIGISLLNDVAGPRCTKEAQAAAAAAGAQVVSTAANGTIETSLDSQVANLRNAGADTVVFCNDPVNTVKFVQAAQRVGWKPTFVGGFVAADDVPKASGANAKGMYGYSQWDFYNSDLPGVKRYRQITEYYFPQTFHHFYEQAAYVGAEAIVAALRAAGPNLTRDSFLTALRAMHAFDTGLGITLNFANLRGTPPSGIMLQADDSLAWKVVSGRFTDKGAITAAGTTPAAAAAATAPALATTAQWQRRQYGRRGEQT
jgi:branched-chain amino acid transport system substrate-binding protein